MSRMHVRYCKAEGWPVPLSAPLSIIVLTETFPLEPRPLSFQSARLRHTCDLEPQAVMYQSRPAVTRASMRQGVPAGNAEE